MPSRTVSTSAVAGMSMVTAGSMAANAASYLLHLPASRFLGLAGYAEFASLLAAQLVLAVPALALQSVVARDVVRGRNSGELRSLGYRSAAVVAVLALVASPVVAWALQTGVLATVSALVVAPVLVVLATEQGLLQGSARFGTLSIVLAAAGLGKVVPAVVVLAFGGGPGIVLAASAVGTSIVAVGARLATRTTTGPSTSRLSVVEVLAASQVQLALILLSSVDLVLVKALLDDDQAGLYALGAVATKAAFWLPQAVGVVLYPRMANPKQSASALRSALAVVAGIGAVLVVGCAVASPLLPLLVGDAYAPVKGYVWIFALQGACLAVLQSGLLWAIAGNRTRLAAVAWVGLVVEVVLLVTVASTVVQFVTVAASVAAVCAAVMSAVAIGASRP
ncbi:polysaccharide biosynthesis protein [Rhodococcus sp. Eu-32]|uniref:polysaccharide biosynthesis protein n=1 Tax=Rhodococcus sp. Eu-32 TaxID=1017319 RepID=UPI000DF2D55A|nr:polysaccharide biosynthesis protein [Rhodococcus sp. Eu-32]RRQ25898.1 polysaccharide biosynthesis protein [Rhodococcus sp. Eu-32]